MLFKNQAAKHVEASFHVFGVTDNSVFYFFLVPKSVCHKNLKECSCTIYWDQMDMKKKRERTCIPEKHIYIKKHKMYYTIDTYESPLLPVVRYRKERGI